MVGGLAHSGPRDPRRRRGDGRGLLHLRPLRAAAAEGDGRDPRRRRPARRLPGPAAAAAGLPAPRRAPAAWYLPSWLDRILPDVRFGHGEATPARSPA